MTTSRPNDSPDEPTAVASAQAGADGGAETEGKPESAATRAERILTPARPALRSAVPSALSAPEEPEGTGAPDGSAEGGEEEQTRNESSREQKTRAENQEEGSGEPAVRTAEPRAADPAGVDENADRTSAAKADTDAKGETASASGTAAQNAIRSGNATGGSAKTGVAAIAGRPNKGLLAGAAIVGALLISVPFMVSGGDGDDGRSSAKPGATPGTMLERLAGAAPSVVGSESPSPQTSKVKGGAQPKTITTTGPDGKPVVVTPKPGAAGGGKKGPQGGGPVTVKEGEAKPSSGSGSGSGSGGTSNGTSSGSGGTTRNSDTYSGSGSSSSKSEGSGQTTPSEPWSGGVQIYSHASGRCIGVANSPNAPVGSKLVIWDCYNESYQRWKFVNGTVQSEGKCMNVSGGATHNGAVINWTTCNGSGAQQFHLNAAHDLTNPQSGNKCVDVIDQRTDNGARLQLWQCYGTNNQKWSTRTP